MPSLEVKYTLVLPSALRLSRLSRVSGEGTPVMAVLLTVGMVCKTCWPMSEGR